MGNSCIDSTSSLELDLSLTNIWNSWFKFRRGKTKTKELEIFSFYLEQNLQTLYSDLNTGRYRHGIYKKFIVTDNKRREIRVADIRDRIIHRLLYGYLYEIYDKTFIYDAWSCRKGMPIGNLTSQIFANIYLNELDRFVKHILKPQAYLRYGDDFIIISKNLNNLKRNREKIIEFLATKLKLEINAKNDIIVKARWGLKFLGVWIYPKGRKLNKRNWRRAKENLNRKNISSYSGLIKQHSKEKIIKEFNWRILEKLNQDYGKKF